MCKCFVVLPCQSIIRCVLKCTFLVCLFVEVLVPLRWKFNKYKYIFHQSSECNILSSLQWTTTPGCFWTPWSWSGLPLRVIYHRKWYRASFKQQILTAALRYVVLVLQLKQPVLWNIFCVCHVELKQLGISCCVRSFFWVMFCFSSAWDMQWISLETNEVSSSTRY